MSEGTSQVYCRTFDKGDSRIEPTLRAIEDAIQRPLDHYVSRALTPKKLTGSRVGTVSDSLIPADDRKHPTALCTPDSGEFVQVTLWNVGGHFNGYTGDPYAGCIVVRAGTLVRGLVEHLGKVVVAADAFHAFAESGAFSRQKSLTIERLRERRATLEAQKSELGPNYMAQRQLLDRREAECKYSLKELPLKGVAPHGKEFDMRLHWMNYINGATARKFDFPNDSRDEFLAGLYERLGDGWLFKVSHEEPDLGNANLRERVEWMYRHFNGLE